MAQSGMSAAIGRPNLPRYYSHSGVVPPLGLIAGLLVGAVVAGVGGFVYGYADLNISFIYVRVVMTFGFGALLGWLPARVMRDAKVRNVPAVVGVAGLTALAGYYVCWASWIWAREQSGSFPVPFERLLESPALMFRIARIINEFGAWTLGSGPVTGIALGIVWLSEALIIIGAALATARRLAGRNPFCETCDRWADGPRDIAATRLAPTAELRQRLESNDFDFLPRLEWHLGGPGRFLQWDLHTCDVCKEFNTLTVVDTTVTRDRRGRTRKRRKVLINKLIVAKDDAARLAAPPVSPSQPSAPLPPVQATAVSRPATEIEPTPRPPSPSDKLLDL